MEATILAVSRRDNGVCIAGVDENLNWLRPVKARILVLADIMLNDNMCISPSCVYDFSTGKADPSGYQKENYIIDENTRITHVKSLMDAERERLFSMLSENSMIASNPGLDMCTLLKVKNRSLIMLGPVALDSVELRNEDEEVKARVDFSVGGVSIKNQNGRSLPCTDLRFLAFAKDFLEQMNAPYLRLNGAHVKRLLNTERFFIVVGLTAELWKGDYWPMAVAINTVPEYGQSIDYAALFPMQGAATKHVPEFQGQSAEALDPELMDEYYETKAALDRLQKRENELKEIIKKEMVKKGISQYDSERMVVFCRKFERVWYPKERIEEFVPEDILGKIRAVKEILQLFTKLRK